VICDQL